MVVVSVDGIVKLLLKVHQGDVEHPIQGSFTFLATNHLQDFRIDFQT